MWQVSNWSILHAFGEKTTISGKQQRLKLSYQILIYTDQVREKKGTKQGTTQMTLAQIDGKGEKLPLLYLVMLYVESCSWTLMTKWFQAT